MATSFHGFAVKEKIGAGGMSTVYLGHHETLGYPVAIKILHPGMGGDQNFISRFEREAKAASSLHNNNIATVIDFGSEDGIYFIVMQYIDGEDLGKILKRVIDNGSETQFPLEISLPLLEEVAYGLKDAHQQGIIHRDIKPSNILLSKKGEVKIADFGLARDTSDVGNSAAMDLTMPGTVVGTPSYMSPEQAVGGELDLRTDIFSLGVMAYQLIAGEKPFTGDSPADVQEQIINAEPPQLSEKNCARITPEIENFLAKTLAKDPANRFQNMDQVIRALMSAQESIDPSGGLLKYRREYMTKFATSPLEFSVELREKAVNGYLKRGYYFKNMGLSSINDAIREFGFVLSMDPDHAKARAAVTELKKKAEESGILPAAPPALKQDGAPAKDMGKTQVLPAGTPAPRHEASKAAGRPAAASGRSRRGLLFGGLGAAAIIAVALIFVLGRDKAPTSLPVDLAVNEPTSVATPADDQATPPAADDVAAAETGKDTEAVETPAVVVATPPAEPPPRALGSLRVTSRPIGAKIYLKQEGQEFRPQGTAPVTIDDLAAGAWEVRAEMDDHLGQSKVVALKSGADREVAMVLKVRPAPKAEPPPPSGPGYLKLNVVPYGNVYVDDKLVKEDARGLITEVPVGARKLRISHPKFIGDIVFSDLAVASGDTLDLGRQQFLSGSLKVATSVPGEFQLLIDSGEISGPSPLDAERVLVGRRYLGLRKPGFVVDKAWVFTTDGKRELTPEVSGPRAGKYLVEIQADQLKRIKFDLKTSP